MAKKQPPKNTEDDIEIDDGDEREGREEPDESVDAADAIDDADIVPDIGDELDDDLLHDIDTDIEGIEEIVDEELPPAVGGELDAFCTKCKRLTNHTVVSVLRGRPAKVLCNACESQHQYRTAAPEPSSRESRVKSAPKNKELWKEALSRAGGEAVPYQMSTAYELEQVIDHKKFGQGVVIRVYDETKMEVLFEDQVRRLIRNRKAV